MGLLAKQRVQIIVLQDLVVGSYPVVQSHQLGKA